MDKRSSVTLTCYKSKKGGKDQYNRYNQVPHLTQDATSESEKNTIKHHKPEPRGQPFPSRWPQGSNEQTRKTLKNLAIVCGISGQAYRFI